MTGLKCIRSKETTIFKFHNVTCKKIPKSTKKRHSSRKQSLMFTWFLSQQINTFLLSREFLFLGVVLSGSGKCRKSQWKETEQTKWGSVGTLPQTNKLTSHPMVFSYAFVSFWPTFHFSHWTRRCVCRSVRPGRFQCPGRTGAVPVTCYLFMGNVSPCFCVQVTNGDNILHDSREMCCSVSAVVNDRLRLLWEVSDSITAMIPTE